MAVSNIRGDYFRLWQENAVDQPYLKNSSMRFGEYLRGVGNFYVAEILIACNTSSIPSGSTVTAVTIDFNITVNSLSSTPLTASVHTQNKGSWIDNGSTSPVYNTFANTAWSSALTTLSVNNTPSTGNITFPTSASLVSLVQGWVNGTGSASDGLILGINASFFGWFLTGTVTNVNVTYTTPVTGVQGLKGTSNTFENKFTYFTPIKGLRAGSNTFSQYAFPFTQIKGLRAGSNTFELDLSKFNLQRISKNHQK